MVGSVRGENGGEDTESWGGRRGRNEKTKRDSVNSSPGSCVLSCPICGLREVMYA